MNAEVLFESTGVWHTAGWTMLHFLWMGTLVALAAGACRLLLRRASPNVRYVAALACLALLAVSPAIIVAWLVGTASPFDSPSSFAPPAPDIAGGLPADHVHNHGDPLAMGVAAATSAAPFSTTPTTLPTPTTSITAPRTAAPTNPRQSRGLTNAVGGNASPDVTSVAASGPTLAASAAAALRSCVPYLPWVWLLGTPLTFGLLATGIVGTRRLRRASRPIVDGPIKETLARLVASLRVGTRVGVAVCERVAAPVLVGILRPMILLPPAALTGWSPDEIEMVLLHELAHVRRWDNAVNLAQRIVESLLFFHPVVWLVSNWVRREREACCDAVVVGRTNRPHAYAELLVNLAAQMKPSSFGRGQGEGTSQIGPTIFSPASPMAAGPLRTRIRRILQMEDDPMLVSGKSLALVLASLLVAATLAVLYLPAIGQAEESTPAATEAATEPKVATTEPKEAATAPQGITTKDTKSTEKNDDSLDNNENITELRADRLQLDLPGGEVVIEADEGQVKVRQDAANDDWMKGIAFSSPKEGEIARRAWKELGIKVVPASEVELEIVRRGGFRGGLKVLGLEDVMNIEGPLIMTLIQSKRLATGVGDFAALERALDALSRQSPRELIILQGIKAGGGTFQYSMQRRRASASTPTLSSAPSVATTRFPSLADQKLADAAFRTLGWELEPIGADDLARVKTLGYDGGVRVAYAPSPSGFTNISYGHIQTGDILVGLHVWPTTSLAQVMEVLARDDLAELNPIKFYIVRSKLPQEPSGFAPGTPGLTAQGPQRPASNDFVMTGRITVQVDRKSPQPQSGATSATLELPREQRPTFAPPAPSTAAPSGSATGHLNIPQDRYQAPTVPSVSPVLAPQPSLPPTAADSDDKANLRYDGKTFDEWRTAWRTELSTKKRIEAVQALAAFGGSGYAEEAAEAMLEIARQYDWRLVPGKSTNPFQDAILDALFGNELTRAIPAQAWFPRVMEGVRAGDKPSQQLMQRILLNFHGLGENAEFATDSLLELTRSGDPLLRYNALMALAKIDRDDKDPRFVARLQELLNSDDPQHVTAALDSVYRRHEPLPFDASHLLFHADEQIRQRARNAIHKLRPKQDKDIGQWLMDVVNDSQRADDHVAAIRAIGSLRKDATPAYATLEKRMLDREQPLAVRVAAMKALKRITNDESIDNRLREVFLEENKDRQDTPEFRGEFQQLEQVMQAEEAAIP